MESNLLSISQQFSGLPMDSLIGGPLNAAADANAKMAMTQTKFILDTCFSKGEENGKEYFLPIMISMELERPLIKEGSDGTSTTEVIRTTFNLPLMTIMSINSLAVDSVDIKFDMEVSSSFAEENSKEKSEKKAGEASLEAKIGYGVFSATIKGKASYDSSESSKESQHYKKSNSAKYHVSVHAGQLPLPTGIATIIDAFSKSIDPITVVSKPKEKSA